LLLHRPRRPGGQHDLFRHPDHPPADRSRRAVPGRALPAQEQGARPEGAALEAPRSRDAEAEGRHSARSPHAGRHGGALREDPHLQLPAEPGDRSPRQSHDPPAPGAPRGRSRPADRADPDPLPVRVAQRGSAGLRGGAALVSRPAASLARRAKDVLEAAGIEAAAPDAEVLLAHVLGLPRTRLHAHPDEPVPAEAERRYLALVARRASREPLQYLTGIQEFWSLALRVSPGVLIP